MAHEIKADSNTYVGYNFLTQEYYIKNLDTRAAAKNAQDAKIILDVTSPTNTITAESIEQLSKELEPVTAIYYTWEDTGKYIKTIFFNTYKTFAMQYDEPFLYVRGSNEMWNMSTNISKDAVAEYMWQYFVYYLGLDMPKPLIDSIISYYTKIQSPYCYNEIKARTEEDKLQEVALEYTNKFILNNADGSSRGEYTGVKNPDELYTLNTYTFEHAGEEKTIDSLKVAFIKTNTQEIVMKGDVPENCMEVGEQFQIDYTTKALNGIYHVAEIGAKDLDMQDSDTRVFDTYFRTYIKTEEQIEDNYVSMTPCFRDDIIKLIDRNPTNKPANVFQCKEEPECNIGDYVQVTGVVNKALPDTWKNIKDLKVVQVDGKMLYTSGATIPVYSYTAGNHYPKVWINAYRINSCGYVEESLIKSSQRISSIKGNTIAIMDVVQAFDTGQYTKNQNVVIVVDGKEYKAKVTAVTPTSTTDTNVVLGSVTLDTSINKTYQYNFGAEPAYIQVRDTVITPSNSFVFSQAPNLVHNDVFEVFNLGDGLDGAYTVDYVEGTRVYVKDTLDGESLTQIKESECTEMDGIAQVRKYSERILLDINYSRLADRVPVGEFMLDDNQQFSEYLQLYRVVTPKTDNYLRLNQEVEPKYYLGDNLTVLSPAVEKDDAEEAKVTTPSSNITVNTTLSELGIPVGTEVNMTVMVPVDETPLAINTKYEPVVLSFMETELNRAKNQIKTTKTVQDIIDALKNVSPNNPIKSRLAYYGTYGETARLVVEIGSSYIVSCSGLLYSALNIKNIGLAQTNMECLGLYSENYTDL